MPVHAPSHRTLEIVAPVIVCTVLAFAVALLVLGLAGLTHPGAGGPRQFLSDLRSGLRRRDPEIDVAVEPLDAPSDADAGGHHTSVAEIFGLGTDERRPYVGAQDIAPVLQRAVRATERRGRRLGQQLSRPPRPAALSDWHRD